MDDTSLMYPVFRSFSSFLNIIFVFDIFASVARYSPYTTGVTMSVPTRTDHPHETRTSSATPPVSHHRCGLDLGHKGTGITAASKHFLNGRTEKTSFFNIFDGVRADPPVDWLVLTVGTVGRGERTSCGRSRDNSRRTLERPLEYIDSIQ